MSDGTQRTHGMSWDEIEAYAHIIKAIAIKYSSDRSLAEDVIQEVKLKLYEDKRLDITKFNPETRDAAIRNTIRNKTIKVLKSRKLGRWQFESLEILLNMGVQIDSQQRVLFPYDLAKIRLNLGDDDG